MDTTSEPYYVSLGYVCTVVSLLESLKKRSGTNIFDRMGTPMWAINELVATDFADFFKKENLVYKTTFANSDKKYLLDSRYNIRQIGDDTVINNQAAYDSMKAKMDGFVENFLNRLKDNSREIVFIRVEEPHSYEGMGERIPVNEDKYAKSERQYVNEFSELLKSKYPGLKFRIVFMSNEGHFVEEGILGLPSPQVDFRDIRMSKHMLEYYNQMKETYGFTL